MGLLLGSGELLGSNSTYVFPEMGFSIEKVTVSAKTRALKAEYSLELAQDLKAIHGLDAETELANILSAEILSEINREVVRTINVTAERGASEGTTTAGIPSIAEQMIVSSSPSQIAIYSLDKMMSLTL